MNSLVIVDKSLQRKGHLVSGFLLHASQPLAEEVAALAVARGADAPYQGESRPRLEEVNCDVKHFGNESSSSRALVLHLDIDNVPSMPLRCSFL